MRGLGRWGVAAAVSGLVLCAPAEAVLPPAGLEVGGGAVYVGKGTSRTLVSAAVGPDGRTLRFTGSIGADCGKRVFVRRSFQGTAQLGDDGTFAAADIRTQRNGPSYAGTARADISGTFDGVVATGEVRLHDIDLTRSKRRCPTTTGTYALRDPGRPSGAPAPAPAPGTLVFGLTNRAVDGLRGAVIGRVTKNGKGLAELTFRAALTKCGGAPDFEQYTPTPKLTADGRFDKRERFKVGYSNAVDTWFARARGSFLAGGALQGRWDARIRTRYTKGRLKGKRGSCSPAARLRFWAVP